MNQIVTVSGFAMMALLLAACGGQANSVKKEETAAAITASPQVAETPSDAVAKQPCDAPKSDTNKNTIAEKKPCDSSQGKAVAKVTEAPEAETAKKPCCASKKTAAAPEAPTE